MSASIELTLQKLDRFDYLLRNHKYNIVKKNGIFNLKSQIVARTV